MRGATLLFCPQWGLHVGSTVRILQHLLYDEDGRSSRSRPLLRSSPATRGHSDGWYMLKREMNTRTPGIRAEETPGDVSDATVGQRIDLKPF